MGQTNQMMGLRALRDTNFYESPAGVGAGSVDTGFMVSLLVNFAAGQFDGGVGPLARNADGIPSGWTIDYVENAEGTITFIATFGDTGGGGSLTLTSEPQSGYLGKFILLTIVVSAGGGTATLFANGALLVQGDFATAYLPAAGAPLVIASDTTDSNIIYGGIGFLAESQLAGEVAFHYTSVQQLRQMIVFSAFETEVAEPDVVFFTNAWDGFSAMASGPTRVADFGGGPRRPVIGDTWKPVVNSGTVNLTSSDGEGSGDGGLLFSSQPEWWHTTEPGVIPV